MESVCKNFVSACILLRKPTDATYHNKPSNAQYQINSGLHGGSVMMQGDPVFVFKSLKLLRNLRCTLLLYRFPYSFVERYKEVTLTVLMGISPDWRPIGDR
jgi:hypothetical protein